MNRLLAHPSSSLLLVMCLLPLACADDAGAEGDATSGTTHGDGTTAPGTTATVDEPDGTSSGTLATSSDGGDTVSADDTVGSSGTTSGDTTSDDTTSDDTTSGDTTGGSSTGEPACEPGDDPLTLLWGRREGSSTRMVKVDLTTATILAEYEAAAPEINGLRDLAVSLGGRVASIDGSRTLQLTLAHDCPAGPTSSGPDDVLPLGEDACVLARIQLAGGPGGNSQNVAWTPGTWDETECAWQDEALWVRSFSDVRLLDGDGLELGAVDLIPYWQEPTGSANSMAVDGDGNLWVGKPGVFEVAFIERSTLAVTVYPVEFPGWGGEPLIDGMARPFFQGTGAFSLLDVATQTWQTFGLPLRCGIDHDVLWCPGQGGIQRFDLTTLTVDAAGMLPYGDLGPHPAQLWHDVEADGEGHLWIEQSYFGVDEHLVRYDLATADVVTVEGVRLPHYGDATGQRLRAAMGL